MELLISHPDGRPMDPAERLEMIEGIRDKLAGQYPNALDMDLDSPADVFALILLSCATDGGSLEASDQTASGSTETMRLETLGPEGEAATTTAISFATTGDGLSPEAAAVAAEIIAPDLSQEIDNLLG